MVSAIHGRSDGKISPTDIGGYRMCMCVSHWWIMVLATIFPVLPLVLLGSAFPYCSANWVTRCKEYVERKASSFIVITMELSILTCRHSSRLSVGNIKEPCTWQNLHGKVSESVSQPCPLGALDCSCRELGRIKNVDCPGIPTDRAGKHWSKKQNYIQPIRQLYINGA